MSSGVGGDGVVVVAVSETESLGVVAIGSLRLRRLRRDDFDVVVVGSESPSSDARNCCVKDCCFVVLSTT